MGEGGRTMLSEKAGEMKEARQPLELELELPWASDPMSWISRRGLKLRAVGGMVEGGSGKFLAAARGLFKGPARKSWRMMALKEGEAVGEWRWWFRGVRSLSWWWRLRRPMSFQTSSMVLLFGACGRRVEVVDEGEDLDDDEEEEEEEATPLLVLPWWLPCSERHMTTVLKHGRSSGEGSRRDAVFMLCPSDVKEWTVQAQAGPTWYIVTLHHTNTRFSPVQAQPSSGLT